MNNHTVMNNTDLFANPLQTVHFLSIFSSINILTYFFYDKKLLTSENAYKPIPVINTLCDYLKRNNESAETIIAIGHRLLKNSDLYGSKETEPIHVDYVNAMIDHIIVSTVFAKFSNTFGYLSAIVNSTNNLTLSFVKQKIMKDLNNQKYLNEDGTISNLSDLTIKRITEKLIFPLFPQPDYAMKIIDVDYIYAQAGLMLTRASRINEQNISFDEYIVMSQSIEQAVLHGQMDQSGLSIFQLPALLYYTYKKKEVFRKKGIETTINRLPFWKEAFSLLFSDLNATYEKTQKLQEKNPVYQFHMAFSDHKNRTKLAEDTLRSLCAFKNESHYAEEINNYKYYYSNFNCLNNQKQLPDLNKLFSEQNKRIAEKYFLLEKAFIRDAFGDELIKFVENSNVTVYPSIIYYKRRCGKRCASFRQKLNSSIDLFEISSNGENPTLYALIRNDTNISLLSAEVGMELFLQRIGLNQGTKFKTPFTSTPLKSGSETFDTLATNLAKPREEQFLNFLQSESYEPTTGEIVIEFLKNFIPFYPCAKISESGKTTEIVFTCFLDALTLIPVVGEAANIGFKFVNAALKPFLLSVGSSIRTFMVRQSISLALKNGIRVIALEASREFSKIITKQLFKNMAIAVMRSLDPGIELGFSLSKAGVKAIVKCFSVIGKKIPSLSRVLQSFKNLGTTAQTALLEVGTFRGHNVYTSSISGYDGYGIKYMRLHEENVELRRVAGYKFQKPVIIIGGNKKGKNIYKMFDLEKGEAYGRKLEVRNGVLQMVVPPLAVRLKTIKEIGLSGRGKLPSEREAEKMNMFQRREGVVDYLKKYKNEDEARTTLSQYILQEKGKEMGDFAIHWRYENSFPEWSKNIKLNDVKLYESLRYDPYLEALDLTEDAAAKSITDYYGEKYVTDVIDVNPRQLFQTYSQNTLHDIISFKDYYAVSNWQNTGASRILLDNPEGWQMRSALYRLAIRQVDDSVHFIPQKLYAAQKTSSPMQLSFVVGTSIKLENFIPVYTKMRYTPLLSLEQNVKFDSGITTLFQFNFASPYLAANIQQVLPLTQGTSVLFPEMKFVVKKTKKVLINDKEVEKVYMTYIPFHLGKSEAIAKVTNNIKDLNDWETQFYHNSVLNDFDLDLLN